MRDWREYADTANMPRPERHWLRDWAARLESEVGEPCIVHLGVQFGVSLNCSRWGSPRARIVGVDLDISKCTGEVNTFELIESDSAEAGGAFHDPIHFLFVDGDHHTAGVHDDIRAWIGNVRPGGVIAFHDYYADAEHWEGSHGVRRAVDAWDWSETAWDEIAAPNGIRAFYRRPFLQRGDEWGTVGIGVPYFKPCYDFFRWWSWMLVGGLEPGDQFLNTECIPGEMPIPIAHNALVEEFLKTDRDTLVIVEDDHVGDQEVLRRMRQKVENLDFDIVCASYPNRRGHPASIGVNLLDANKYGEYICVIKLADVWKTGTQPFDCAALGLVQIRRWVVDAMLPAGMNPSECFWFDWVGRNSQDIQFYAKARDLGALTGVDRDNDIGHIGRHTYTMREFHEILDEAKEKEEKKKKQEVTDG